MGLSEEKLKYFAAYIERELGIIFNEQVYFQLEQRLDRVAQYIELANADAV